MRDDEFRFLSLLGKTSARLSAEQVTWILNCQPHDIPCLVRARLLKPLGNPPASARKAFSTEEVLESTRDKSWLSKVSNAIHEGWWRKNHSQNCFSVSPLNFMRSVAGAPLGFLATRPQQKMMRQGNRKSRKSGSISGKCYQPTVTVRLVQSLPEMFQTEWLMRAFAQRKYLDPRFQDFLDPETEQH